MSVAFYYLLSTYNPMKNRDGRTTTLAQPGFFDSCNLLGMRLVTISNKAENEHVRKVALDNKPTAGNYYPWIASEKRPGRRMGVDKL